MNRTIKRLAPAVLALSLVVILTACNTQRYGNDWISNAPPTGSGTNESGTPTYGFILEDRNVNCDNPNTTPVETCADQGIWNDGIDHIYNDINGNCINISGGSWGTVGTVNTISSATVDCFIDGILDDPNDDDDLYSAVCLDSMDPIGGNVENDCQNPDGSGNYKVLPNNTAFYRDMVAGTFSSPSTARATVVAEWARDWSVRQVTESGATDYPDCLFWNGTGMPTAHRICP